MMRYLDADAVRRALPMMDAIEATRTAFSADVELPLRSQLAQSLVMPGRVDGLMGIKVVSTVPGNPAGLVAVFDGQGSPVGIVDGHELTSIRTGAVTGLATDLLAPRDITTMAMLGAGEMAADMIEAVRTVRVVDRVQIWSRTHERAAKLAADVEGGVAFQTSADAVAGADVISCATPATSPIVDVDAVAPGAHINAVGAFRPDMAELGRTLLERAYVVVDDLRAAAAEAGDLIQAGREPNTTLFELVAGTGPQVGEDLTVFKSVGLAIQDVATAHRALVNAAALDIGVIL